MKNKILKIMGIVMTIAMLASFMVVGSPVSAAGGPTVPSINEWEGVVLPSTVPNSDVELIEQANDGTIFISVLQYFPGHFTASADTDNFNWEVVDDYTMRLTDCVIAGTGA